MDFSLQGMFFRNRATLLPYTSAVVFDGICRVSSSSESHTGDIMRLLSWMAGSISCAVEIQNWLIEASLWHSCGQESIII